MLFFVGPFFVYEAMIRHEKLIKAIDRLKASKDKQNEKVKELELRLVALKGKMVETRKKLLDNGCRAEVFGSRNCCPEGRKAVALRHLRRVPG